MNKDNYPKHWQKVKLRQILKPFSEKNYPELPLLSVVREKGVIIRNIDDMEENHNYVPDDLSNYKRVKCGQFAINKMKAWQGSYGISKYNGIVSPAYFVFDVTYDMNLDFFNRAIRSKAYIGYFGQASDGIRVGQWDLSMHRMKEIPFFIPPRNEQDKIAEFLDSKTAEIDKLAQSKKREIIYLNELKHSLIFHAVTCGLVSCNKQKSNIEFLNEIPSHWREHMLFQVASEQEISNQNIHNQNLLSLSYGKIKHKDIKSTEGLLPSSYDTYQIVNNGNIILRLTDLQNDHRSLRVGLATETGIITSAYTCLKVRDNILPHYLYFLLHSYDVSKVFYGMGGGVRQSIGYNDIRRMLILCPPIDEQQAISEYCIKTQNRIETLINSIDNEIKYLEELKTSLIADTVIGKIDVRHINC